MKERFVLEKYNGKKSRELEIIGGSSFEAEGYEGAEECGRVIVRVSNRFRGREIPMVTKEPHCFVSWGFFERSASDRYISTWTRLREAGIPVIPTMRKKDNSTVLMTDLTRDGSTVYGRHQAFVTAPYRHSDFFLKDHRPFMALDLDKVRVSAIEILDRATGQGITLANDGALDLVVNPRGSWSLIALDITRTIFNSRTAKLSNQDNLNSLMGYLSLIRENIIDQKKTVDYYTWF